MANAAQSIITITKPNLSFDSGHKYGISGATVLPYGRGMVTRGQTDKTLRLWEFSMKDRLVSKKLKGHSDWVEAVAVSGDGLSIASGDDKGKLTIWCGDTGKSIRDITAHSKTIYSLDFSLSGSALATGSSDCTMKLWDTKTWKVQGNPIECGSVVKCVRFSPSGELLAIAANSHIEIWNLTVTRKCIAKPKFQDIKSADNISLVWTPDGTRLLSAGATNIPTIWEWNTSTWQQVGNPWVGHTHQINDLAVNPTGTLVASASSDHHVFLWRLSGRQNIAVFKHPEIVLCVAFSTDGKHIFSGGFDKTVSEWAVPRVVSLEVVHKEQLKASKVACLEDVRQEQLEESEDVLPEYTTEEQTRDKILHISMIVRNACIIGDLPTAEKLLTEEIDADGNNHNSYANRSLVVARKGDWDHALDDALKSVSIRPSLTGCISQSIALCGQKLFQDARKAFDLTFMFTDRDSSTNHFLLLVKAIILFNANEHEEAILRVQELAAACPNADTLACRVVEAYLHVQLGINALDDARHDEAADRFTAAINTRALSSEWAFESKYEVFVVLFGWNLKSLWQIANQKRCDALLQTGRLAEAHKIYRYMIDTGDEATMQRCHAWCIDFKKECCSLCVSTGDAALATKDYNKSIELYSVAIDLDSANDTFAKRCTAKLKIETWEVALLDAQKVIELNPSSYLGYELKHAALHGAQQYDEAVAALGIMLARLNDSPDMQIRVLRQQYMSQPEARYAIRKVIDSRMENFPPRLLDTSSGRLCDRDAQINAFEVTSTYSKLLSSTMRDTNLRMERIHDVVETFFQYVMLSHRWEAKELPLNEVQDRNVYDLDAVDGTVKLQSFCKVVRDARYRWAWSDTCCIDKSHHIELQQSVNSMFIWYRHSTLTIVYLSDVPPLSRSGALAKSVWNRRGWTVQEFIAAKVVLFYQKDWTLYLGDCSPNHKDSLTIMQELGDATGIDPQALVAFHPGMRSAREKLQWMSMRSTTLPEDIAYSLFGIFNVHLPVIYGENKQNALGRLLQEVVAQLGEISALDWVGKSCEFNSCLPADIASYGTAPYVLPYLSEGDIQTSISLLQHDVDADLASRLYHKLNSLRTPQFMARRLHLPCLVFPVTDVMRKDREEGQTQFTFTIKANGLQDLSITTEDKTMMSQFLRARRAPQATLLVRPWDRSLLELPDFADLFDTENMDDWSSPMSLMHNSPGGENQDSESYSQALRLLVRLGQPFSAFLLEQQRGGEYKRIISDQYIIAQVKDTTSVFNDMIDVRTLEIL